MRNSPWGMRQGALALALAGLTLLTATPAEAGGKRAKKSAKKSLADCSSIDQTDRSDEDGLDFTSQNSCGVPVACTIKWTVVCAPDVRSRRSVRSESAMLTMQDGQGASASAIASCGADGWSIKDITWTCDITKD